MLIDRAFLISIDVTRNNMIKQKLDMNKAMLLKVLYNINSPNLLKCFSKNA